MRQSSPLSPGVHLRAGKVLEVGVCQHERAGFAGGAVTPEAPNSLDRATLGADGVW